MLGALLMFALTLALALVAAGAALLVLYFAARRPLLLVVIGVGLYVAFRLAQRAADWTSRFKLQEAFATDAGTRWRSAQPSTEEEVESEQGFLRNLLAGSSNLDGELRKIHDPDVEIADSTAVPVIPGITELALSESDASIQEIRCYLNKVRTQHTVTAVLSISCFIGALAFSLYATVLLHSDVWRIAFGGLTVSTVLGGFCFVSLRDARVSQIALALFESYISELRVNLREAELSVPSESRREHRAEAWRRFRIGLNELWLHEEKRGARDPHGPPQHSGGGRVGLPSWECPTQAGLAWAGRSN